MGSSDRSPKKRTATLRSEWRREGVTRSVRRCCCDGRKRMDAAHKIEIRPARGKQQVSTPSLDVCAHCQLSARDQSQRRWTRVALPSSFLFERISGPAGVSHCSPCPPVHGCCANEGDDGASSETSRAQANAQASAAAASSSTPVHRQRLCGYLCHSGRSAGQPESREGCDGAMLAVRTQGAGECAAAGGGARTTVAWGPLALAARHPGASVSPLSPAPAAVRWCPRGGAPSSLTSRLWGRCKTRAHTQKRRCLRDPRGHDSSPQPKRITRPQQQQQQHPPPALPRPQVSMPRHSPLPVLLLPQWAPTRSVAQTPRGSKSTGQKYHLLLSSDSRSRTLHHRR